MFKCQVHFKYKKMQTNHKAMEEVKEQGEDSELVSINLFAKVEDLQPLKSNSLKDRFNSKCKIGSTIFEYSRYDSGKVDSAEDGIFISVYQCQDTGRSKVFSYCDNFVRKTSALKLGKGLNKIKENLGLGVISDKLFVESLFRAMSTGKGDLQRITKALSTKTDTTQQDSDSSDNDSL